MKTLLLLAIFIILLFQFCGKADAKEKVLYCENYGSGATVCYEI